MKIKKISLLVLPFIAIISTILTSCSSVEVVQKLVNINIILKDDINQAKIDSVWENIKNPNTISKEELIIQLSILLWGIKNTTINNITYKCEINISNGKKVIILNAKNGYSINGNNSIEIKDESIPEANYKLDINFKSTINNQTCIEVYTTYINFKKIYLESDYQSKWFDMLSKIFQGNDLKIDNLKLLKFNITKNLNNLYFKLTANDNYSFNDLKEITKTINIQDKIIDLKFKENITLEKLANTKKEYLAADGNLEKIDQALKNVLIGIDFNKNIGILGNMNFESTNKATFTITQPFYIFENKNKTILLEIKNPEPPIPPLPEDKTILTKEMVEKNFQSGGIWSNLKDGTLLASDLSGYTEIGAGAFKLPAADIQNLYTIEIPNTITKIGDRAFESISQFSPNNIRFVVFEENSQLTHIGKNAFYYSGKLKKITIPKSVIFIDDGAFNTVGGNLQLEFEVESNLEFIGIKAFANLGNEKLILPSSLKEIGNAAFFGSGKLTEIYIPTSVTIIGNSPFFQTTFSPIEKLTIPMKFKDRSDKLGFDDDIWIKAVFI